MIVNPIGSNKTEVHLADGTVVLFSYRTAVAALVPGRGWIRTNRKWSSTTSRHINSWLADNMSTATQSQAVDQWDLDQLVAF